MIGYEQPVNEHYGSGDLAAKILEALRVAGKDASPLAIEDLAPIDQLHARGRVATLELARLAGITPRMRVLDVGGGMGGPARTLAGELGCAVEVLDLTERFCRAGEVLTAMTGLADLVSFRHGSALEMPYPDATFDVAWMQHSSMNVADKERKSTRLNSSHANISYAVFCLKKKTTSSYLEDPFSLLRSLLLSSLPDILTRPLLSLLAPFP